MASRIKGITVEIGGDTSGLEKSLSAVNNSIKKIQSQLRDVNNLLKLDPSNTILLAQKQELLQSAIGDTEKKLEAMEQAQEDVAKAFERGDLGKDQYMAFQREVEETRGTLSRYKADLSGLYSVVSNGFSSAVRFITGLPGQAFQWGKDFIQGLINGISSMIQSVINTVSGLADRIRSFLHFSAPDEGPLADYETWMPDFMKGLAGGIEKNRNLVEKAVKDVASDMVVSPKVNGMEYGYADGALSGGNMSDLISGISSAVSEALAGFSGPQGNIVIPVYVGGTLLDELVVTAQARQNLRSGGR